MRTYTQGNNLYQNAALEQYILSLLGGNNLAILLLCSTSPDRGFMSPVTYVPIIWAMRSEQQRELIR